jgi:hypothetical protein
MTEGVKRKKHFDYHGQNAFFWSKLEINLNAGKQPKLLHRRSYPSLAHKGSNLNKQNQNLLCYHYTMSQKQLSFESDAKISPLFGDANFLSNFFR